MAPKRKGAGKQATLHAQNFWPLLPKPAAAVGKFASVPAEFWDKVAAADKGKRYRSTVMAFEALHDFGSGRKGAGFLVKEMGERGTGSLEPGVA